MKEPERTDFIGMLLLYAVSILGIVGYIAGLLGMFPLPEKPLDEHDRFVEGVFVHGGGIIFLYSLGFAIWIHVHLWHDRRKGRRL